MVLRDITASHSSVVPAPAAEVDQHVYLPPRVERLGSLAELTLGGKGDPDDGFGGAGDEGSV